MPDEKTMTVLILANAKAIPTRRGGTEVVADGLSEALNEAGWDVHVAAHTRDVTELTSERNARTGIEFHEMPPLPPASRWESYAMYSRDAPGFDALMGRLRPGIVQLHGISIGGCNWRHVELAKRHGAKVVVWHNVPGITCLQRGLLYEGKTPCDGRIRIGRCTQCRLRTHFFRNRPGSGVLSHLITRAPLEAVAPRLPGAVQSLVRARSFTERFAEQWQQGSDQVDTFRVGAAWAERVLQDNGVPPTRLRRIPPGVDRAFCEVERRAPAAGWFQTPRGESLRLVYWGRIHPSKGVHTVLQAVLHRPELPLELILAGSLLSKDFEARLIRDAAGDARIRFMGPLSPKQLIQVLDEADLGVVPSRWHETGPLTVLEARARGLPIVGARRGGIAELCAEDRSARLFDPDDHVELAALIAELAGDPAQLDQMTSAVPTARTIQDVAKDVRALYEDLLERRSP